PPYNTDRTDFPYKDSYQHSSWLSMLEDRVSVGRSLLSADGCLFSSIDATEAWRLNELLYDMFGENNRVGTVIWKGATDNNPTHIAEEHEYVFAFARSLSGVPPVWKDNNSDSKQLLLSEYERLKRKGHTAEDIQAKLRKFIRTNA